MMFIGIASACCINVTLTRAAICCAICENACPAGLSGSVSIDGDLGVYEAAEGPLNRSGELGDRLPLSPPGHALDAG